MSERSPSKEMTTFWFCTTIAQGSSSKPPQALSACNVVPKKYTIEVATGSVKGATQAQR